MEHRVFTATIPPTSPRQFTHAALLLGIAVFLVLVVFQPFGTYTFQRPDKVLLLAGYGIIITFTTITMYFILHMIFTKWLSTQNWSLKYELIMLGIIIFITIVATYFYHHVMIGSRISLYNFLTFNVIAISTAVFPLAIIIIIRYMRIKNYLDQQALMAELTPKTEILTLEGENKTDRLNVVRSEILFIKAADNYVEIYLKKDNKIERHLLRGTLTSMVMQLKNHYFLQVHRSYLVNMNQSFKMSGKSPNYQLIFESVQETVPVSRNKIQEVRQWLAAKPV
ncbi:MAG: LytR/AlgR family response regulator transcription factor [Saprospiraceae bacterium]